MIERNSSRQRSIDAIDDANNPAFTGLYGVMQRYSQYSLSGHHGEGESQVSKYLTEHQLSTNVKYRAMIVQLIPAAQTGYAYTAGAASRDKVEADEGNYATIRCFRRL